jgi:hypothetical protein
LIAQETAALLHANRVRRENFLVVRAKDMYCLPAQSADTLHNLSHVIEKAGRDALLHVVANIHRGVPRDDDGANTPETMFPDHAFFNLS